MKNNAQNMRDILWESLKHFAPDRPPEALHAFLEKILAHLQDKKNNLTDFPTPEKSAPQTAMDSANLAEERLKAKTAVRPLVGNVLGMDEAAPEEIYRYGLNHVGIKTEAINLQGLKSLVAREASYRSPERGALAKDSAALEAANPEAILEAYIHKLKSQ